jgi:hypothetical protein
LNLCGFLTYCFAYCDTNISHCSTLLLEVIPFSSVKTAIPLYHTLPRGLNQPLLFSTDDLRQLINNRAVLSRRLC